MKHEKHNHDEYSDEWLEKLDAIVAGEDIPSAGDDELLHVAARLATALAPLKEMDRAAEIRRQHFLLYLRARQNNVTHQPRRRLSRSFRLA